MARHIIEQITDDIDGSSNADTYSFAWQGTEYTIDLSNKNFKALDKALKPYLDAATKVSGRRKNTANSKTPRKNLADIRAWAKSQNLEVADRGRMSSEIVRAYDAAH